MVMCLGWVCLEAQAADYYVSPTGSAGGDGSPGNPWSLSKANSSLVAGDTAILMDGSYSTPIAPSHNGSAGLEITYQAQNSRQAVLTISNPRLNLQLRSYITVDGIKGSNGNRWAIGNFGHHLTINDCDFRHFGSGSFETGRFRDTGGYIHVTNSYFDDHADGVHIREGSGHYIANTTILEDEHSPLVLMGVNQSVVENCYFSNPVHRCIEVLSTRLYMPPNEHRTDYIVIQDSYFYADDAKASAIKMNGSYSIVRRNVFDGCTNSGLRLPNAYGSEVSYRPEGWFSEHNRLYNNTFYNCTESIQASKSNTVVSLGGAYGDHIWVNNIIYNGSGIKQINLYSDTHPSDVAFYYNSIMRTSPGQDVYYWNGYYTVTEIQAAFPAYNANNVQYNPQFTNAAADDFTLQPTSPCIDAGGPLTTTVGSGSGAVVPVADALYFTDGYGLIDPDVIYVGWERVTIVSVNYATNQITVDRSISWGSSTPVYADYNGAGPDLGAYETQAPAEVVGRYVFYNNSFFDGNDPAPNACDDGAIATDKTALLPGGTGAFANYTSYARGINGVMVDIENLPAAPTA
ncbi:MAG: right-handed parallel beta-helix repeat-containing protein, partial [Phycisphaerae bacterium]|nr:right-handed parallel beta-helix repeat-containing protein [Phycisphaerae bacterium]